MPHTRSLGAMSEQTISGRCSQEVFASQGGFMGRYTGKDTTALSSCASSSGRGRDFVFGPLRPSYPTVWFT